MPAAKPPQLSRREREIMDILYRVREATAAQVRAEMAAPPSYSAVRSLLRVLEEKGRLRHRQDGPRFVYRPAVPRDRASRSALRHLMQTFFGGSTERVVSTLLDLKSKDLSDDELDRLAQLIERAKQEGR